MTDIYKAAKLALEYLEKRELAWNVQIALREALAEQPAQQQEHGIEVMQSKLSKKFFMRPIGGYELTVGDRLYISPPARKPLTDEQIEALAKALEAQGDTLRHFARAIEAAHGIKENT